MRLDTLGFRKGLILAFEIGVLLKLAECQYLDGSTRCGSLFADENFHGLNFSFIDGGRNINLRDDNQSPDGGWNVTKSITIQHSCSMEICDETYLNGECHSLKHGEHSALDLNMTSIASAACSCVKECSCDDIFMKKSSCARAYLKGGCRRCNADYVDLEKTTLLPKNRLPRLFSDDYSDKVNAFRIRKGCTLTIYPPKNDEEEDYAESTKSDMEPMEEKVVFNRETVEGFRGRIGSHECNCNDNEFVSKTKPPRPNSYPDLIDVPTSMDDVIKMLRTKKYSTHPGLMASFKSMNARRSGKNAYIMLLGATGSGKSSAINLLFNNPNITKVGGEKSTTTDIHEFRMPVPIDELGVANSELRIIDTPGLGDTRGLDQDAKFLATMEDYLTSHEELNSRIPNVVLIFDKFSSNRFDGNGSTFVRMLRGFDTFRSKITDENYSNVIFVLSHFCSTDKSETRRPQKKLARFKHVIEEMSQFPKPTLLCVAENKPRENELPMVNGFAKLPNKEYYPRNLFEKLELVTEKGGDPIGLGVYRTAFRDSDDANITSVTFKLLPNRNEKVAYYLGILQNALMNVIKTEVSEHLQKVWETEVGDELKQMFPGALAYLQKTLYLKNINKMENIPRTATAVVELLMAIKHDNATRALIEKGLQIKPPVFPATTIAGNSYNVFKDTPLSLSPFVMGNLKQSDIGFLIPTSLSVTPEPMNKNHYHMFDGKTDYIQYRLGSLGIEGRIDESKFTGIYKPGHNIKSISFKENGCSVTATREVRLYEFQLNDRLNSSLGKIHIVKAIKILQCLEIATAYNDFLKAFAWRKPQWSCMKIKATNGERHSNSQNIIHSQLG